MRCQRGENDRPGCLKVERGFRFDGFLPKLRFRSIDSNTYASGLFAIIRTSGRSAAW